MFHSPHQLLIHPTRAEDCFTHQALLDFLMQRAIIGQAETRNRYQVGEKFLDALCFLGCSPYIELYPQADDQPYCYIEVPPTTEHPRFIASSKCKYPRCPHCKTTLTKLPALLKAASHPTAPQPCPHCQNTLHPATLPWRKSACFARSLIVINNIYESEAVPETRFLEALQQASGFGWRYCYIRQASG